MGGYGPGAHFILDAAVRKNDLALAEWALTHGASPERPTSSLASRSSSRDRRSTTRPSCRDFDAMADLLRATARRRARPPLTAERGVRRGLPAPRPRGGRAHRREHPGIPAVAHGVVRGGEARSRRRDRVAARSRRAARNRRTRQGTGAALTPRRTTRSARRRCLIERGADNRSARAGVQRHADRLGRVTAIDRR